MAPGDGLRLRARRLGRGPRAGGPSDAANNLALMGRGRGARGPGRLRGWQAWSPSRPRWRSSAGTVWPPRCCWSRLLRGRDRGCGLPGRVAGGAGAAVAVAGCQLPVASCQLPVASCQLPVAGCQLPVASCQLPVAGCQLPVASCQASCRLSVAAASCRLPATTTAMEGGRDGAGVSSGGGHAPCARHYTNLTRPGQRGAGPPCSAGAGGRSIRGNQSAVTGGARSATGGRNHEVRHESTAIRCAGGRGGFFLTVGEVSAQETMTLEQLREMRRELVHKPRDHGQ